MTTTDLSAYEADITPEAAQPANILAKITNLARELRTAQADVATAQEHLKHAQDRVRMLEQQVLPAAMDEAQQDHLRTTDGWELNRGEELRASIPPDNLGKAVMWLVSKGQAAIVKREVKLSFGKGEDQKAAEMLDVILEAGGHPTDKQSVHPQTLAATIRELLAEGVDVPMELLGAYVQPYVKMKPAGEAKKRAQVKKATA